jgi:polyphosphate glucokinase
MPAKRMGRSRKDTKGNRAERGSSSRTPSAAKKKRPAGTRTLAIDIGGTGLKALVLDERGDRLTERVRVETPRPATPEAIVTALVNLVQPLAPYERVSVGFPGVVVGGATRTAPNLDQAWVNFELRESLEHRLKRPVRVLNDAGVQGYGVIDGKGVEMVLTLGTGMGAALYINGQYVPNLELAHHPFRGKKTYEDYVGGKALTRIGQKKWNKRVAAVIAQVNPIWNPRRLYIGGGNAKHLRLELPSNVRITDNVAGLLGGIKLWDAAPDER